MSIKFSVTAYKKLRQDDFRILNAIERGMSQYMYVPIKEISRLSSISLDKVEIILKKLNYLGLVQRQKRAYIGYILTSRGYDCLAIHTLVKRNVLNSISSTTIGTGKEAEVYIGMTPGNVKVAVKIHRAGRTSFRQIKIKRSYVGDRKHVSWLYESRLAASNEYKALSILYPKGVSVPMPIDWNRHIVVTEFIEAIELSCVPELPNPASTFEVIIENIKKAALLGVIHGDISEYNILISEKGPVIFDWPQWVSKNHPSALMLFRRDIANIAKFFRRKYNLKINIEKLLDEAEKWLMT